MKQISVIIRLSFLLLLLPYCVFGQNYLSNCNSFETSVTGLYIDTNGVWSIGNPDKTSFDSSYSGQYSIVTGLFEPYMKSDTSSFYIKLTTDDYDFPNYLGGYDYIVLEFKHRFLTNSIHDYGRIDISFEDGKTWYDIHEGTQVIYWKTENNEYGFHEYLSTGEKLYNEIPINNNSNGWIHSRYMIAIDNIVYSNDYYPIDTVLVRFSFITDSIGEGNDGWQIDDLCIYTYDKTTSIDNTENNDFKIYPNPNSGNFKIELPTERESYFEILNIYGQKLYSEFINTKNINFQFDNLSKGIYLVRLKIDNQECIKKLIINN